MVELIVWPRLSTCSKRAMVRLNKKWGHPYRYYPRQDLIQRLKEELNLTQDEVIDQIYQERAFIISHIQYFR